MPFINRHAVGLLRRGGDERAGGLDRRRPMTMTFLALESTENFG